MTELAALGLRAGAAGWKAGHAAVRSGRLRLDGVADAEYERFITEAAAVEARPYRERMLAQEQLTPAQSVRLWAVFMHAYMRGVRDEALDGGALMP